MKPNLLLNQSKLHVSSRKQVKTRDVLLFPNQETKVDVHMETFLHLFNREASKKETIPKNGIGHLHLEWKNAYFTRDKLAIQVVLSLATALFCDHLHLMMVMKM